MLPSGGMRQSRARALAVNHVASWPIAIEVAVESVTPVTKVSLSSLPVAGSILFTPLMPPSQIAPPPTRSPRGSVALGQALRLPGLGVDAGHLAPSALERPHRAVTRREDDRLAQDGQRATLALLDRDRVPDLSELGPIWSTASLRPWLTATQTEPSPTVSPIGIPSAGIPLVSATSSVSGSIVVSVRAFGSRTQTEPSPAAIRDDEADGDVRHELAARRVDDADRHRPDPRQAVRTAKE